MNHSVNSRQHLFESKRITKQLSVAAGRRDVEVEESPA